MKSNPKATQKQPDILPAWLSYEVSQALDCITGDEVAKKERTVLRLAQAMATGISQNEIFRHHRQNGVVNKKYWTGFGDKPGWKDDPAIAHALDVATARARWWVRVKEGKGIEESLDIMKDAAPDVARQIVRIALEGRAMVTVGDREEFKEANLPEILKAGDSVLNRVSVETATKASSVLSGEMTVRSAAELSDDDLASIAGSGG